MLYVNLNHRRQYLFTPVCVTAVPTGSRDASEACNNADNVIIDMQTPEEKA